MRSRRLLALATLLLSTGLPLAFADQVVYFVNGKAIMAKSVEKGDKFTVLEMEGGGKIGVPTEQITKIEDYVVAAPQPPAPIAAAAPAPVQTAPLSPVAVASPQPGAAQPPAVATNVPAVTPVAPGPGLGGRPIGAPNADLAHVTPLDINGNNQNNQNGAPNRFARPYAGQLGMGPRGGGPGGPALATAGRPGYAAGGRFAGRGLFAGRGGRPGMADGRGNAQTQAGAPGGQQPQQTPPQPGPSAQPQAQPQAPAPSPAPAVEPEAPPEPAADSNEEPSDSSAPAEDDSSGNSPGAAN